VPSREFLSVENNIFWKYNFMTETIQPARVLEAVRYFDTFYRNHNISLNGDCLNQMEDRKEIPFIAEQLLRQQSNYIRYS